MRCSRPGPEERKQVNTGKRSGNGWCGVGVCVPVWTGQDHPSWRLSRMDKALAPCVRGSRARWFSDRVTASSRPEGPPLPLAAASASPHTAATSKGWRNGCHPPGTVSESVSAVPLLSSPLCQRQLSGRLYKSGRMTLILTATAFQLVSLSLLFLVSVSLCLSDSEHISPRFHWKQRI